MREAVRLLLAVALLAAVYARPNAYEADAIAASERHSAVRVVRELEVASDTMSQLEVEAGEALIREKRGEQLDDWLSDEQKEEIKTLKENGGSQEEIRDVIMRYYEKLPAETRNKYDTKYKKECIAWVHKVASEEEVQELKALYAAKDVTTLETKISDYMERLSDNEKKQVLAWKEPCKKLWETDQAQTIARRLRRELGDEGLEEWNEYLTHSEREELRDLHSDQVGREVIDSQIHHVYLRMPYSHQEALKARFRDRCLRYLRDVAENGEYESYVDGSDADEVVHKYFARLIFERHNQLSKFKSLCHQVLSSSRRRREIEAQFSDWMSWMTDEQKKEISGMKDSGKSYDEIHDKVIEHFNALDTSRQGQLRADYKQKCKGYFKKLATSAELEKMDELFQAGKEAEVKDIVQTVIERQPENIQVSAKKFQKICTEVFGASRRRRTISDQIDKTLSWLTPEQKQEIREMHQQGRPGSEIKAKFWEYLEALEPEKKKRVTEATIKSCYEWMEDVTSQEERDEIQRLHHIDHNQCKEKVYSYLERLPEQRQNKIRKYLDVCERLWYGSHHGGDHNGHHGHHGHHHRRRRHGDHSKLDHFVEKYLTWMDEEEKLELEQAWGEEHDKIAVRDKVLEIYEKATGEKKEKATKSLKTACKKVLAKVVGEENVKELEELKASGASKAEIAAKVQELTESVSDPEMKELVEDYGTTCRKVFEFAHRQRRHDGPHTHEHNLDHYISHHLKWLSEEQKDELRSMDADGANRKELQDKVLMFYEAAEGDAKEEGTKELQRGCREIMKSVIGEEKAVELKVLQDAGASYEELEEKLADMIAAVPDDAMKQRAIDFQDSCKAVFGVPRPQRTRRHQHEHAHNLEHYLAHHLTWLTPDQKDEIKLMKVNGKSKFEIRAEIFKYYNAATGEVKEQATQELQSSCRELLVEVVGEEEANKLKAMKESGSSVEEIEKKVSALIQGVTDDHKKEILKDYGPACKKLFAGAFRRRRHEGEHHDHHEHGHTLDNYLRTHLKWLTDAQKDELREMKASGVSREKIQEKVFVFFNAATGDVKEEAIEQLRGGCRELLTEVVGKAEATKLKELKETGASVAELEERVNELLDTVTDDHKKQLAKEYGPSCKKVFGMKVSRRRRHEGHHDHHDHGHSLDNYLTTHLKWLTEDQKDVLRGMKVNGKPREAIQEKIFEFYEATTGERKQQATQQLQGGCREIIAEVIGKDEAAKLKQLKESGASIAEIEAKINALVAGISDEHKKDLAEQYGPGCRRLFGVASRRRRDHHHEHKHSLDHYLNTHLKWLTEAQKDEIRDMKANGMPRGAIQEKVFAFFNAATGETKEEAIQQLQGGCRELLTEVVGKAEAAKLKEMKETGASIAELEEKINDLLETVSDDHKKQLAKEYGPSCKKVFGMKVSRRRRDTFDNFVAHHLKWLSADQKAKIDAMKAEGKSQADIHAAVTEFYRATTGDAREEATQHLQAACRELLVDLIGKEKVGDVKTMRETGASVEEIEGKLKEHFEGITDNDKKKQAALYGPSCRKLFGGHRRRRAHHTLEEYFDSHLSWLSEGQKEELRDMKLDGESRKAIHEKVMEFYNDAEGETKEEATEKLQNGCRQLFASIVGEEKAAELRALKERGATFTEIEEQVTAALAEVSDGQKKRMASEYGPACKELFRGSSRRRRDHHEGHGKHSLEDYFKTHLKWLSDDQKDQLKEMKAEGKTRADIQAKVFEFYNAATGEKKEEATEQLKGGCRQLLSAVVGKEKALEVKAMKESGASFAELQDKVDELMAGIQDEHKKKIAEEYGPACRKVFSAEAAARKRRDHHEGHHGHHTLEDYFKTHLKWLTEDQKEELRTLKASGKSRADIQQKVFEFYNSASGDVKEEATEQLQGGCRELLQHVVGKEKAAQLKTMKESGASLSELQTKVDELLGALEDDHKKQIARDYGPACKRVFGVASGRFRRHRDERSEARVSKLQKIISVNKDWMSDGQVKELTKMKDDKASPVEFREKIMKFYQATEEDAREKATLRLQSTCKVLLEEAVGAAKVEELDKMRREQAHREEIIEKVDELFDEIDDDQTRREMEVMRPVCERVLEYPVHGRQRRTVREQDLSMFREYLEDWLTEEQMHELEAAYYSNAPEKTLKTMVLQYFLELPEPRRQALEVKWKGQCLGWLVEVTTEEQRDHLQLLMRTKQIDVLREQILVFMNKLDDTRRQKVALTREVCENLFGLQ
ncbi:hypothetical protein QR680_006176 [Steinernema hermaphroditum]|uniref:Polyprotein allergen nematode domain-containing protein n=1 Tax=Steinernema hermaphroditum TaxID=289476 RepID=A0AA39HUK0_9BILA|nr:hypothetical protein QR680_006176 [Steinernema hermaphroditum]